VNVNESCFALKIDHLLKDWDLEKEPGAEIAVIKKDDVIFQKSP